jgi:hypothetical protein
MLSQKKMADVWILQEFRVLRKNGAVIGIFDVGLERHQPLPPRLIQQLVRQPQGSQVTLPSKWGAFENDAYAPGNLFQDVQWVGDEHGTSSGSGNDEQLRRLEEDFHVAVLH